MIEGYNKSKARSLLLFLRVTLLQLKMLNEDSWNGVDRLDVDLSHLQLEPFAASICQRMDPVVWSGHISP